MPSSITRIPTLRCWGCAVTLDQVTEEHIGVWVEEELSKLSFHFSRNVDVLMTCGLEGWAGYVPACVKHLQIDWCHSPGYRAAVEYLLYRKSTSTYTKSDLIWSRSQRFITYGRDPDRFNDLLCDWLVHIVVYNKLRSK